VIFAQRESDKSLAIKEIYRYPFTNKFSSIGKWRKSPKAVKGHKALSVNAYGGSADSAFAGLQYVKLGL